jgi:MFS family permease
MRLRDSSSQIGEQPFLLALGLITLSGFALRLIGLGSESMTADELYALICTRQSNSLHELIYNWVAHDGHPPFSYILEYIWQRWFGTTEGALRFPFAVMGTAAIWWTGRIGARWFSSGAGLAAACGLAFLQLPLMYSQLTRPYACGLFFVSFLTWCWTRWLFDERSNRLWLFGFVVGAAGAVYSHYFSFLVAVIVGIAGLFFSRGRRWSYLLAGLAIVVLFLPYLSICIGQLQIGGIGSGSGGWLAAPQPSFFAEHICAIFNRSKGLLIVFGIGFALSVVLHRKSPGKFHVLAMVFFLLPLLIGYGYSVWRNPVLQHSVLLFSLPFFLLFVFAWMPSLEKRLITWFLPVLFFGLFAGYVTLWKPYHLTDHFGRLKEIAEMHRAIEKRYGSSSVTAAFNVDFPYYLGYYWGKQNTASQILFTKNDGEEGLVDFRRQLNAAKGNYFVYGWSTCYSPPEMLSVIHEKYPVLVRCSRWFNSACYVFSKDPAAKEIPNEQLYLSQLLFKQPLPNWSDADTAQLDYDSLSRQTYFQFDSSSIYSPGWSGKLGQLIQSPDQRISVRAKLNLPDSNATIILVVDVKRKDKSLYWYGRSSKTQYIPEQTGTWQTIYFGLYLPEDLRLSDDVVIYAYSENKYPARLAELEVSSERGHPGLYGFRSDYLP